MRYICHASGDVCIPSTENIINDLTDKRKDSEGKLQSLSHDRAQLQNEIDNTQSQIETQEHKIAKEGGGYANRREELKILKYDTDKRIQFVEQRIRELCVTLLPFSLAPEFCNKVKERINAEEEYRHLQAAREKLTETLTQLQKKIKSSLFWNDIELSNNRKN